jgi:hypothetical protein
VKVEYRLKKKPNSSHLSAPTCFMRYAYRCQSFRGELKEEEKSNKARCGNICKVMDHIGVFMTNKI